MQASSVRCANTAGTGVTEVDYELDCHSDCRGCCVAWCVVGAAYLMSLPRHCLHHGCPALVRGDVRRCPTHASEGPIRPTTTARYGSGWAKTSARIIRRDGGWCRLQLPGCTHTATTADHIISKVNGGTDADTNLQAACRHCNSAKGSS